MQRRSPRSQRQVSKLPRSILLARFGQLPDPSLTWHIGRCKRFETKRVIDFHPKHGTLFDLFCFNDTYIYIYIFKYGVFMVLFTTGQMCFKPGQFCEAGKVKHTPSWRTLVPEKVVTDYMKNKDLWRTESDDGFVVILSPTSEQLTVPDKEPCH